MLKSPANTYFRLSDHGWFLWQRLDGHMTVRELSSAYINEFKLFRPDFVTHFLRKLADAGFLQQYALRSDLPQEAAPQSPLKSVMRTLMAWGHARCSLRDVDRFWTAVYQRGGKWFCTGAAVGTMAALGALGLGVLFMDFFRSGPLAFSNETFSVHGLPMLVCLLPMIFLDTMLHETGHALATKHAECRVNSMGVGWYLFGPLVFIDTSDAWLAPKRARMTISLAGPLVNWAMAGGSVMIGIAIGGLAGLLLLQFAVSNYLDVLFNLNPLMKLDGYYILIDAVERPNLRAQSFTWFRQALQHPLTEMAKLRTHPLDVLYALGSCVFVILFAGITLIIYRVAMEEIVAAFLSPMLAAIIAWLLVIGTVTLAIAGLWAEFQE